jgi:hypothetical protein
MLLLAQAQPDRIGPDFLGILIPLATFLIAFISIWILYRRFSGPGDQDNQEDR